MIRINSAIVTILYCLFIQRAVTADQQIFINYSVDNQGIQLYKFFHDVSDGFYVDIGAYDSIFASNTLNLATMGWTGINIDASPKRSAEFYVMRPWENSINTAIGDQDKYLTLYDLAQDSSSTVIQKVKQMVRDSKPVTEEIKVPSMSMKQLCNRYFHRKPLFINLDIEGYGSKALQGNDWSNPKCCPDIIFSEINQESRISGLPLPETVLKAHGYKRWPSTVGLNQIYIQQSQYAKYITKYNEGKNIIQKKQTISILLITNALFFTLNVRTNIVPHYDPRSDGVFFHFVRHTQPVDIDKINRYSNQISTKLKNRPIIVLNFNPHLSCIVLKSSNYSVSVKTFDGGKFWNLTIFNSQSQHFSVFIFDHRIEPLSNPKIIVSQASVSVPKLQVSHDKSIKQMIEHPPNQLTSQGAIILGNIQKQLDSLKEMTNKTNTNIEFRLRQLMATLLTNHHYDKSKLQDVLMSLQTLNATRQQFKQSHAILKYRQEVSTLQEIIAAVILKEVVIMFVVFFLLLGINVLICVTSPSKNGVKKQYNQQFSSINFAQKSNQNLDEIQSPQQSNLQFYKKQNKQSNSNSSSEEDEDHVAPPK